MLQSGNLDYNYLYTRMVARTVKARLILPQANSLCYKDGQCKFIFGFYYKRKCVLSFHHYKVYQKLLREKVKSLC